MATTAAPAPPATKSPAHSRQLNLILAALMLGMILASLDQTIVSTALPTIVGDLGGLNHLSWVVTSYLLASTVSTPLYGKLGDQYGRKRLFLAAIVIFLIGSALCGLSQTLGELIAFRALQGLGGGGLMVGAQAVMADVLPPRERGRYSGYFGAVFGVTSIAGPLIGGFLVDHASWRWVFYVNLPFGILALAVVSIVLKTPTSRVQHQIDYLGSGLLAAFVTCVVLVTTWGGSTYAWGSPTILAMIVGAFALLAGFIFVEGRAAEPVIPLSLFRNRVFTVSSGVGFIVGFTLFGVITYLPQYQQVVRGASATASGLQLFPLMGGLLIGSIGSGQIISRSGRYKMFPIAGCALLGVGMFLLSHLGVHTSVLTAGIFMAVTGFGLGLTMQVLVLAVQNTVAPSQLGVATSAATFFRSIGGVVGVSIFSAIFNHELAHNLVKRLPQLGTNPAGLKELRASPEALAKLPPAIHNAYLHAFTDSLHVMFLWAIPFALLAFGLTWLLEEVPLRTSVAPIDAVSEGFGMLRSSAVQVQAEGEARVAAARAALARLPELGLSAEETQTLSELFSARISYLEEMSRETPEPDQVGAEGWQVAIDVLRTERETLATASEDETSTGEEFAIRLRAAHAALARLEALDPDHSVPALQPLRDAYNTRIERLHTLEVGAAAREDLTPSFWRAAALLLSIERETLVTWGMERRVDGVVADRADRDIATEAADLEVTAV